MLEFITVDYPKLPPHSCAACGAQTGPLVDTHREIIGVGRVYICDLCVRRAASVRGLVKGKRMSELIQAGKTVERLEGELADRNVAVAELERLIASANAAIDQQKARAEDAEAQHEVTRRLIVEAQRVLDCVAQPEQVPA